MQIKVFFSVSRSVSRAKLTAAKAMVVAAWVLKLQDYQVTSIVRCLIDKFHALRLLREIDRERELFQG
jgi:hypothetical protein